MNFRLANNNDLAKVQAMYRKIIDNMNSNNIGIWDKIYKYRGDSLFLWKKN